MRQDFGVPAVIFATARQVHNPSMQLNFIANQSVPSLAGQTLDVIDPSNGQVFDQIQRSQAADIDQAVNINVAYVHEKGYNAVTVNAEEAISSFFVTSDFGYPTGGARQNDIQGVNRWTRLVRIEPDFIQSGEMNVEVVGREFAQQPDITSPPIPFLPDTGKIDLREQRRQIRLRFSSNTINGNFEMGRVILHTEPGDVRS